MIITKATSSASGEKEYDESMKVMVALQAKIDDYNLQTYDLNVKLNEIKAQQGSIVSAILAIKPKIVPLADAKGEISRALGFKSSPQLDAMRRVILDSAGSLLD